uniref:CRISPR type III-associated protein domain-containing protein n=1 Tax=Desulfomonile tiedjei TaxID=2358 RepID=A0A7C4ATB3_9BACT
MKRAAELDLNLPQDLHFEPDHASLPASTWFGIEVSFTLASPWYSRDDRPFHVLDNPVRKDRVFGVPFMSAASWKGLLRWACRMQAGLSDHLEKHNMKMDGWEDPTWIVHLFGNEKGEDECFQAGALVCYPTWFNKIGFEVINPHSRTRRAGTQPIYYEVVPAGTKGRLRLLYSPLPGEIERDKVTPADFIASFINSIKELLETYGISAKRTAGLGTARIDYEKSKFFFVEGGWMNKFLVESEGARHEEPPREEFKKLLDKSGNPISSLLDENGELKSKTQFKKLQGSKPCTNREFEEFKEWWEKHGKEYRRLLSAKAKNTPSPHTRAMSFQEVMDAVMRRPNTRKGGDQ